MQHRADAKSIIIKSQRCVKLNGTWYVVNELRWMQHRRKMEAFVEFICWLIGWFVPNYASFLCKCKQQSIYSFIIKWTMKKKKLRKFGGECERWPTDSLTSFRNSEHHSSNIWSPECNAFSNATCEPTVRATAKHSTTPNVNSNWMWTEQRATENEERCRRGRRRRRRRTRRPDNT